MTAKAVAVGGLAAVVVITGAIACTPFVFAGRILPGVMIGGTDLTGIPYKEVPGVLSVLNNDLENYRVTISLRGKTAAVRLADLGIKVDANATAARAQSSSLGDVIKTNGQIVPVMTIDTKALQNVVVDSFSSLIKPPRDTSLQLVEGQGVMLIPAQSGEAVDLVTFEQDILQHIRYQQWQRPIGLSIITTAPDILDNEVTEARSYAEQILQKGLVLTFADRTWEMKPFTVRRLIQFVPKIRGGNTVLGVAFESSGLRDYLSKTIAPEIDQTAQDARFQREGDRAVQFAMPQEGRTLNVDKTTEAIITGLDQRANTMVLAVDITKPAVEDIADIEAIGVTSLLARGESDFAGSPTNRRSNIQTGVIRYHGLLIPSGQEFSFNQHLGPVDAEHGFKPELVIKSNVTTPEFGGGLCQVSTTAFRAAVNAGLKVTQRRNHAYVVRYYGKPGFDSTIYPPYTDLRFINNTPGYILIQARVEGTKVIFEFWGTSDGRKVEVTGPISYDKQPDGSMKAKLTQRVTKDGVELINDIFYSRYKSPDLFPKVIATDDPEAKTPTNSTTPPGTAPADTHDSTNNQPTTSLPTASPATTAR